MADIIELQELLGRTLAAIEELGEAGMATVVANNELVRDCAKQRGAFEMAAESRELWKARAVSAGWFPIVTLADLQAVQADEVKPWNPTVREDGEKTTLSEAVGQALGTASMCWANVRAAGMFDSTEAARVYEGIMAWLSDWADEMRREANEAAAAKSTIIRLQ